MSDIEEIKSRLNIVDIISQRVTLKKAGRNLRGLCPFHNEKSPSFMVSPDRQMFHCFGCGKGGSVFDFVMEYEHVDFAEALEQLAEKAGVKLEHRFAQTPEGKLKQKLYEVNHLASEFYHYILTKHQLGEKARLYLKERGITDKSIQTFMLGYSPNSWEALYRFLRKKGYEENIMEQAGLVIKTKNQERRTRNYYDRFRGRLMFTLKDHRGNVVGFSGRILDKDAAEAKYINTSETPVYSKSNLLYGLDVTKDAISKTREAIIMEGELDVISSFQAGIGNAVAIKGSALTEGHIHLLRRFAERLLFALDSDMAGDAASRRGIELADHAGLDMKVVVLPSGKDPDEAARENPGIFKKAIKEAIPIYDYFLSSATKRFDKTTAYGKKQIADEILPVLAKIDNPIVQGHYIKHLATTLATSEDAIGEGLKRLKLQKSMNRPIVSKEAAPPVRSREEKFELYLLALLLQGKTTELYEELIEEIGGIDDFAHPAVRQILTLLGPWAQSGRVFLLTDFIASLPKELVPIVDEVLLVDTSDLVEHEEAFAKEWTKTLREARRMTLRRTIHTLSQKISASAKEKGDEEDPSIPDLQQKLKAVTDTLTTLEKSG